MSFITSIFVFDDGEIHAYHGISVWEDRLANAKWCYGRDAMDTSMAISMGIWIEYEWDIRGYQWGILEYIGILIQSRY